MQMQVSLISTLLFVWQVLPTWLCEMDKFSEVGMRLVSLRGKAPGVEDTYGTRKGTDACS